MYCYEVAASALPALADLFYRPTVAYQRTSRLVISHCDPALREQRLGHGPQSLAEVHYLLLQGTWFYFSFCSSTTMTSIGAFPTLIS
jgi:hypothetical protein